MPIWKINKTASSLFVLLAMGANSAQVAAGVAENMAALDNSISWLEQQQDQDGSWGNDQALRYSVTTSVAELLSSSNKYTDAYYASLAWIENHNAANVDSLSRKINVLSEHGNNITPDLSRLNDTKPDSLQDGWGLAAIYTSSSLDSALALSAMLKAGDSVGQISAVNYILSSQLADGGWSVVNATASDYLITANVVSGLSGIENPSNDVITALNNAVVYLQTTPTSSNSLTLASVALALYEQAGLTPLVDSYISELLLRQTPAGDWGDIYATAAVSRLLAAALQLDVDTFAARVSVNDQSLRENINQALGKNPFDNLTEGELLQVNNLDLRGTNVVNLDGLEYATNLQDLFIDYGVDLSAISGISGLNLTVDNNGSLSTYINYTLDPTKLLTTETVTETVDYSLNTAVLPTAAGIWQQRDVLHNTGLTWDRWGAQLVMDDAGNAIVLWRQYDNYAVDPFDPFADPDLASTIYSRKYDAVLGWQAPVVVGTGTTDEAGWGGKLLMDWQGNGFALWRTLDPVTYIQTAYIARYDASSGWQTPLMLSSGTDSAGEPEMAMDASGNVMVLWSEYNSSTHTSTTYANRFDTVLGWGTPVALGTGSFSRDSLPNIAMDPQGNAIALWYEYDSSTSEYTIYSRNYFNGVGWDLSSVLAVGYALREFGLGMDGDGNAHVIRRHWDYGTGGDGDLKIYAHRYDHIQGWGAPELLYSAITTSSSTDNVRLTVNDKGQAMLAWLASPSSSFHVRRYEESTGWQPAEEFLAGKLVDIELDDVGFAQAISWEYNSDTHIYTTYASRYDALLGWQSPVVIQEDSYGIWNVDLKINADGDAMILGGGDAGNTSLVAQRYLAGDRYYPIQSGDTWESIAAALYSSVNVYDELQSALGNPPLTAGSALENLPLMLTDVSTTEIPVQPYYLVQEGDSWDSVSAFLYGAGGVADELQTALGTSQLVTGDKLSGFPGNLFDLVTTP